MSRRIDGELITQVEEEDVDPINLEFPRRVEGSEKLWERFAILPNIQGQKYTFGDLFEGGQAEQEEGEFIFYDVNKLSSKSIGKHRNILCEVTVEKNKYWITSCGHNNIWINGAKIAKRTRTRLNFGDFLNLRVKADFGDERHRAGLWFKERELNPEAFVLDDYRLKLKKEDMMAVLPKNKKLGPRMDFTPGMNGLVLPNILSYLGLRHLKQARLVSKLWNEEAAKIMKKRYVVQFGLCNYARAACSMAFFRYVEEMKNTQMTSWAIHMDGRESMGNLDAKLYQDLDWFLPKGHNVKGLKVEAEMYTPLDFEMNIKILAHLQHTLENLELGWTLQSSNAKASEEDCRLLSTICFKKLQKFDLCMISYDEDEDGPGTDHSTLLEPLVQAIKWVSTIEVSCSAELRSSILEYIKKSSPPFPNLVAYDICLGFDKVYGPDDLKSIMELDKPLTKLDMFLENLTDQDNSHHLEVLLLRHSKTLQSLTLVVTPNEHPGTINLPVFPNLKELLVAVNNHDEGLGKVCTFKFSNPSQNYADYARHFPSLQSLTLTPTDRKPFGEWDDLAERKDQLNKWKKYWDLFKVFFPIRQEGDHEGPLHICKSLKYLSIPHDEKRLLPRDTEIATVFPNVFNKWLNKARKQSRKADRRPPPTQMKLRSSSKL